MVFACTLQLQESSGGPHSRRDCEEVSSPTPGPSKSQTSFFELALLVIWKMNLVNMSWSTENQFQSSQLFVVQVEMVYKIISHMAANDRAVFAEGNCGTPRSATVYTGECDVEDLYDDE